MDGTKNHYFSPSVLHEVLYLGYPDSHHKDWLPSCRPTAKLEVVFVSSFGLSYDGLRLIEIAKQICPEKQDSIQFTFIGDGEHRKEWELAAEGCSCVRFLGWCNAKRLHETLNNSHVGVIFMHSHAHIPVPNKFFEYLCYGLVVLSSVPGEMAEIVEQQQIGLTLTDRSKDGDAVRYLEALIDNREHLADIRIKSRRLFADHYCSPAINHRYMQLIEEVLRVTPQE
jgi:glycosyltransferase involved in cell wall biosynthesis